MIRNSNYFILSLVLTAAGIFLLFIPRYWLFSGQSLCLHYRLLGIQCPFCGSTRGAYALLHADLLQALRLNFNILILALLYPLFVLRAFSDRAWIIGTTRVILWVLLAGYILIYLARLTGADRWILSP